MLTACLERPPLSDFVDRVHAPAMHFFVDEIVHVSTSAENDILARPASRSVLASALNATGQSRVTLSMR